MQTDSLVGQAIEACKQSKICFCKFISANDSGETGGHQSGIYIPKNSLKLLFDSPGIKGSQKENLVKIRWQNEDDFTTDSRFIYYGQKTRNEYRITRFGEGFELLNKNSTGDLFILAKREEKFYDGFILGASEDIDEFLSAFGMSPTDTNKLIDVTNAVEDKSGEALFNEYIKTLHKTFPATEKISAEARKIVEKLTRKNNINSSKKEPDAVILKWLDTEYSLFKAIENRFYSNLIENRFASVDSLIETANTILNRRKSRAGRSLEHHLCSIFDNNELKYDYQAKTEKNKRPDFIFPGVKFYFEDKFSKNLVFLASKTTCKDRWRQILNEADRIKQKHLFTLQQGISGNQLEEMEDNNVTLVCPAQYIVSFPGKYRSKILSLQKFVSFTRNKTDVS